VVSALKLGAVVPRRRGSGRSVIVYYEGDCYEDLVSCWKLRTCGTGVALPLDNILVLRCSKSGITKQEGAISKKYVC
jgi:hypothetical protein